MALRHGFLLGAAAVGLGGCASADDVRQRPVVWSAVYAAPYDAMANCITAASISLYVTATPLIDTRNKRAEVLVHSMYGQVMGQYDLREVGEGKTEVSVRSAYRRGPAESNNAADRRLSECAARAS